MRPQIRLSRHVFQQPHFLLALGCCRGEGKSALLFRPWEKALGPISEQEERFRGSPGPRSWLSEAKRKLESKDSQIVQVEERRATGPVIKADPRFKLGSI